LDVRSQEEYAGPGTATVKAGHIPSAKNLEFSNILEASGEMKNKVELEQLFATAGVSKNKKVILYCESSVRAGIVFLALKSVLGYPEVRVYDGAYLEWQSKSASTIETE
jgi:thiosulfate/3-mercaptopyruvate sulfurtransferase